MATLRNFLGGLLLLSRFGKNNVTPNTFFSVRINFSVITCHGEHTEQKSKGLIKVTKKREIYFMCGDNRGILVHIFSVRKKLYTHTHTAHTRKTQQRCI